MSPKYLVTRTQVVPGLFGLNSPGRARDGIGFCQIVYLSTIIFALRLLRKQFTVR